MTDRASASAPFPVGDDISTTSDRPHAERRHPDHPTPPSAPPTQDPHHAGLSAPVGRRLAVLTLTALGVVYGDIGTSPLYTMKEAFGPDYGLTPSVMNVYGVLSL